MKNLVVSLMILIMVTYAAFAQVDIQKVNDADYINQHVDLDMDLIEVFDIDNPENVDYHLFFITSDMALIYFGNQCFLKGSPRMMMSQEGKRAIKEYAQGLIYNPRKIWTDTNIVQFN